MMASRSSMRALLYSNLFESEKKESSFEKLFLPFRKQVFILCFSCFQLQNLGFIFRKRNKSFGKGCLNYFTFPESL